MLIIIYYYTITCNCVAQSILAWHKNINDYGLRLSTSLVFKRIYSHSDFHCNNYNNL